MLRSTIETRTINLDLAKSIKYEVFCVDRYESFLRHYILQFKYHGEKHLGRFFGDQVYEKLKGYDLSNYDCLLPVPSTPSSISNRGYDTVRLIGERLSELCGLPLARDILESLERTPQMPLSWKERQENIKGGFRLIDPSRVAGKGFLVLDDVLTTGSTLDEVMRTLCTAAPRRLKAVVLAKVPPPG